MKKATSITLITLAALLLFDAVRAQAQPAGCDIKPIPLVYTRQPRPSERLTPEIEDAANWSHVTDVARIYTFTEADVVLDTGGKIEVIHNCTASPEICNAQEARVSPDGTKIVYSVSRGTRLAPIMWSGMDTKLKEFTTNIAEMYLYDIPTKTNRRISSGFIDRSPDFCGDDCLVFTSNRAGTFPTTAHHGNDYQYKSLHVYRARITEGEITDIVDLTPHESFAMSSGVVSNGDICWSSWQGAYPRKPGTPQNHWPIWCMDSNGANTRSILGMHGAPSIENYQLIKDWADPNRRGEGSITLKALRPVAEIHKGYLATVDYYRGNKLGAMGVVFGWPYRLDSEGTWYHKNVEAADIYKTTPTAKLPGTGRFTPSKLKNLTPFGLSQDATSPIFAKDGKATGTAGYPAPWPGDSDLWMFTWGRGYCFEVPPISLINRAALGGEPTCKKEIRLALKPVVSNPWTDSIPLACTDEAFHCWDSQAVVPDQLLFGQSAPERKKPLPEGKCFLQSVNIFDAEVIGWPGASEQDRITWQGNAALDYVDRIKGGKFCITPIQQWTKVPPVGATGFPYYGERICQAPEADGSLKMEVACDMPFLMGAIDAQGNTIATDNATHSLRSGESRTCWGCHSHSEEAAARRPYATAEEAFSKTKAGGKL